MMKKLDLKFNTIFLFILLISVVTINFAVGLYLEIKGNYSQIDGVKTDIIQMLISSKDE